MRLIERITITLWGLTVIVLAISTFSLSSPIYGDWWFICLWAIVAAMIGVAMVGTRMWRIVPSLLLHVSFLFMLAGGLATWMFGRSGTMLLTQGEPVETYIESDGTVRPLRSVVTLLSFETHHYPGSMAPRDYVSHLIVDSVEIDLSVNHPVNIGKLRLYQSSYTPDGRSIVGITDDTLGNGLSFVGYLLFAVGGLLTLIRRKSRLRSLIRGLGIITMLLWTPMCYASESKPNDQVLYNGRVSHISTPATDYLLKVAGTRSLGGHSAEDVLKSMLAYPDAWRDKRFVMVKNQALRDSLGISGRYASINDIFDDQGNYRLRQWYDPEGQTAFDKALIQLDEKIELTLRLHSGDFIHPVPPGMQLQPKWRLEVEKIYNHIPFAKVYFMSALTVGLIILLLVFFRIDALPIRRLYVAIVIALLLWQLTGYISRWIIYERIPLGNTGETLVFVSIVLLSLGLMTYRRDSMILPLAVLMSGFAALVANLSQSDPIVTPLVPVLSSPWLGIHVTLVMTAYSLLMFACIVSAVGFATERGRRLSLVMLYPAVYILGLGIFTGAVWAETAWGRYWAWDPKETWALITFMVYAVPLHTSVKPLGKPKYYNAYVLAASLTMLMTYFGVNYLGGLHAYG